MTPLIETLAVLSKKVNKIDDEAAILEKDIKEMVLFLGDLDLKKKNTFQNKHFEHHKKVAANIQENSKAFLAITEEYLGEISEEEEEVAITKTKENF